MLVQGFNLTAQAPPRLLLPTPNTSLKYWASGNNALETLINVGVQNSIPLGLVLEGEGLCKSQLNGKPGEDIADLIGDLGSQIPDYSAMLENGVLVVAPRKISAETQQSLNVTLPTFGIEEPETMQKIGISLWFYIRAVLVPGQSSGFGGGVQRDDDLLLPFKLTDVTVEQVLNYLVTKGSGGLWAMPQVPNGWIANPAPMPYQLISYAGSVVTASRITCPKP